MDSPPSAKQNSQAAENPGPEVLKPRANDGTPTADTPLPDPTKQMKALRRRTYRPSHRATFIGLGVVILILAINAGIIFFVIRSQSKSEQADANKVTISSSVLSKLGVNSTTLGSSGVQLTVGPNAQFNGGVTVAGSVSVGGQFKLNNTFVAPNANLTQLQAGNTSLAQLDVNGNSTLSNVSLRNDLAVTGTTQLQGAVTIAQLLTVDNNLTVTGNLAVGGVLSVSAFSARSLVSTSTLTIGGHVITGGSAPSVGPAGGALGSNGTVSISGNDSAGVIDINIGASASTGGLASVAFHTQYGDVPRVVITPIGVAADFYVYNLSSSGFSIGVVDPNSGSGGLPSGGYGIDYIVEQ